MNPKPSHADLQKRVVELKKALSALGHGREEQDRAAPPWGERLGNTDEPVDLSQLIIHEMSASLSWYQEIFEGSRDAVFISDPDSNLVHVNPAAADLTGYTRDELESMTIPDLHEEMDLDAYQKYHTRILSGENLTSQARILRKDKTKIHAEFSNQRIVIHGRLYMHTTARDITERKQAEEQLEFQSKVLDQIHDRITVTDLNAKITYVNEATCRMLGKSADQIVGQHITVFGEDPKLGAGQKEILETTLKKGQWSGEVVNYRSDGTPVILHCRTRIVKNAQGEPMALCGISTDITDRKRREDEIRDSEKRYRTILETALDGFIIVDCRGRLIRVNEAYCRITGYAEGQLLGKPISDMDALETPEQTKTRIKELRRKGHGRFETRHFRKDGTAFDIEVSARYLDLDGGIYICFIKDISDKKQWETRIQQSEKIEALGSLAAGIAHDFNNILFPLIGHAEMLKEDFSGNAQIQGSIDEILQASARARDLVQQILAFSRQGDAEFKVIKIQPIVQEALKLLRCSIPTTIDIQCDMDPDCGSVHADPTQIHQIVMNLVTNAFHALENRGGKIGVTLREMDPGADPCACPDLPPGSYARLTVIDTGEGIDPRILPKVFDPYFTTKAKGRGTGMGLAVIQAIVNKCGGGIKIRSRPGRGTTVEVYLPVAEGTQKKEENETAAPMQVGNEHILVVDDEEAIVRMLAQSLERIGYEVTAKTASMEALELFHAGSAAYDLVITDMTMPRMTGIELSREIKKIRPDIPVILCTGYSEDLDQERCRQLGIDGYITKPFVRKDLAKILRRVLDDPHANFGND